MKKLFLFVLASFCLAASASSQTSGPRTFDNFDRSQGVQVYLPPVAPTAAATRKKGKPGRGTRVPTADKLVKKTGSTGWTVSVTDGLAQRETITTFGGSRVAMGSSSSLKGFTTGNLAHDSYIVESSRRYNIDPLLIYSQMHQESSFKIRATSHKGASGLMQLMPGTARRFGVTSIYDPKQNIEAGVRYMPLAARYVQRRRCSRPRRLQRGRRGRHEIRVECSALSRDAGICSPDHVAVRCDHGWPLHPHGAADRQPVGEAYSKRIAVAGGL